MRKIRWNPRFYGDFWTGTIKTKENLWFPLIRSTKKRINWHKSLFSLNLFKFSLFSWAFPYLFRNLLWVFSSSASKSLWGPFPQRFRLRPGNLFIRKISNSRGKRTKTLRFRLELVEIAAKFAFLLSFLFTFLGFFQIHAALSIQHDGEPVFLHFLQKVALFPLFLVRVFLSEVFQQSLHISFFVAFV